MMCIISKKRTGFCALWEGTRGVVFTASLIALQSRCKLVPNELIPMYGHNWPSTPECSLRIGDRQSKKKQWNSDRRVICNATHGSVAWHEVIRHRGISDDFDSARPLWRSHSARTEISFANVFLCTLHIPGLTQSGPGCIRRGIVHVPWSSRSSSKLLYSS